MYLTTISRFTKAREKIVLNTRLVELRANMYKELISPERRTGNASPYPASQPFYKVKELYEGSVFWKIFRKIPKKWRLLHMHTAASVFPEWIINELAEDADKGNIKYGRA